MSHRLLVCALTLLLLLLLPDVVFAQVPPPPPPDPPVPGLDALLLGIRNVVVTMQNAINTWFAGVPVINATGKRIAVVLFALVFVWGLTKSMMLGRGLGALAGDAVMPLLLLGLVFAVTEAQLGRKIFESLLAIARVIPGTNASNTDTLSLELLRIFGRAGMNVWNIDFGSGFDVNRLIGGVAKLFAGLALMICGALGCATILLAQMSAAIGAMLAPVLIPWGIWQPTSWLFTSWVRFMVSSGMQVVTTFAIGALVASVSRNFVADMAVNGGTVLEALGIAAGLVLFGVLCLLIMSRADSVASGLVSGDGTLSTGGWQQQIRAASAPIKLGTQTAHKVLAKPTKKVLDAATNKGKEMVQKALDKGKAQPPSTAPSPAAAAASGASGKSTPHQSLRSKLAQRGQAPALPARPGGSP